jgi:hypothetical protein
VNIPEAWETLGENWVDVAATLSGTKVSNRNEAVDQLYTKARKLARVLLAKYHPDTNKAPGSIKKFHSIQEALRLIETETENFKKKLKMKQSKPEKPVDKIVF